MLTLIDCDFISINVLNMKLIFIACFAFAIIIAAQGFSVTKPEVTINPALITKFIDAVLERARLAMRPGTNGNILKVMDPFAQDNIDFDIEKLQYVVYSFLRCIAIIRKLGNIAFQKMEKKCDSIFISF